MPRGEGKHRIPEDESTDQELKFVAYLSAWLRRVSKDQNLIDIWVNTRIPPEAK